MADPGRTIHSDRRLADAVAAARQLGLRPLSHYLWYQVALRSGWLRLATPAISWDSRPLATWLRPGMPSDPESYAKFRQHTHPEFMDSPGSQFTDELRRVVGGSEQAILEEATAILQGNFRLFGGPARHLGFPPAWLPPGGPPATNGLPHWTQVDPESIGDDARLVWEPSRFGWVFPLARAYALNADDRWIDGFWTLFESWMEANPPNRGPNWVSAQEVALRLLALVYAASIFQPVLCRRPVRLARLVVALGIHADRIPPSLMYARAQGNNHLLSEAVGLLAVGVLFPELRDAGRWRRTGLQLFESGLESQCFQDGGYIQHSLNYHRLALQLGLWADCLAGTAGLSLSKAACRHLADMTQWGLAMADPETGEGPNLGPDDGTNLLTLAATEHADLRPTLQAAGRRFLGKALFRPGVWDEAALWLGDDAGKDMPFDPQSPVGRDFPHSGIYRMTGDDSRGYLRCATFGSRPGHADQLHFDLWWRGINLACDPGSYRYRAPAPWDNSLALASVHNAPLVDGRQPMRRAGRFLWLDWDQARFLGRKSSPSGRIEILTGERTGYERLGVRQRRSVARCGHWYLIVDDLLPVDEEDAKVHAVQICWTLPEASWSMAPAGLELRLAAGTVALRVEDPSGAGSLYRAGALLAGEASDLPVQPIWGWKAPTYDFKLPCLAYVWHSQIGLPARISTWWMLGEAGETQPQVAWVPPGSGDGPFQQLRFEGEVVTG
jgi:hypothetical protein